VSKPDVIFLRGGLDLVTPDAALDPGCARVLSNMECATEGGYRRIGGYERFDGQPAPSSATFLAFVLDAVVPTPIGTALVGSVSGATALLANITGTEVALTKVIGPFQVGEQLLNGGSPIGTIVNLFTLDETAEHQTQMRNRAAAVYRAVIGAVPGSGPVSVGSLGTTLYAWRNTNNGLTQRMWRSSPTGWVAVPLGAELLFVTGTIQPLEGQIIVDAVTGAFATVQRVVARTGTFSGGDAAGKFMISDRSGTFGFGNNLQVNGVTVAVGVVPSSQVQLVSGGKVRTFQGVVGGGDLPATKRMYGYDGVNRGFEFDGETYVPIDTGMTTDAPTCGQVFKNHLFFAFGTSLQHSGIADRYRWQPLFGAGELVVSGNITDLVVKVGDNISGSMVILTDSNPSVLYGNSAADWSIPESNVNVKSVANTSVNMGADTYTLAEHGVVKLEAVQNYGNFLDSTLTANVVPLILAHRGRGAAGVVHRTKSQYRVFYADGFGLWMTFKNGVFIGCSTVQFPDPVYTACEGIDETGAVVNFVGCSNTGFVMQLDAGTSFDGENLPWNMILPFASQGDARIRKKYRRTALDIGDVAFARFSVSFAVNYGDLSRTAYNQAVAYDRNSVLRNWDDTVEHWDELVYDGYDLTQSVVDTVGRGVTLSLSLRGSAVNLEPFIVNVVTIHYDQLRGARS